MRLLSTLALFILTGVAFARDDAPFARRGVTDLGTKTSYALPRGASSFVIPLRDRAAGGDLVFVNEHGATEGELSIAISNKSLAADSPHWSAVEGRIRFRNKRLVTVSLVGVDAKFVRVKFQVGGRRTEAGKTADDRKRPYKLARIASS
ncbi:MAG: hypothetical protein M3Q86_02475 [Verrucomicrobiota bacterium]|nr:hypothetical protein [Verrucomicrobiota bacterium]